MRSTDENGAKPTEASSLRTRGMPTMTDIGRVAGVTASTVSRVLNENGPLAISAATRERVLAAARELGYRPNPHARRLRGLPTMLLGAVVRDFSDPFFAAAIEALANEARAYGYGVILGHARADPNGPGESLSLPVVLDPRQTDAIILLGDVQDQTALSDDLRASGVPVVALWQGAAAARFPTADVDDGSGIKIAVEHLCSLGHRRIAFVSARLPGGNLRREMTYVQTVSLRLGGVRDGYVQRVSNTLAGGGRAAASLLSLEEPPTAVVCSTDLVAVGVLHAAAEIGRSVPRDLSVVGFDDLVFAAYTVPALTTLRMPVAEMVSHAVAKAVELARDPLASREPRVTMFEPSLVVRQSTGRPR